MLGEADSTLDTNRLDSVPHPGALSAAEPHPGPVPPDLREAMLAALPSLRAFAMSLSHNLDAADDLVQDTILRAWKSIDRFQVGTNLNAWLFTILRNAFLSRYRKTRREVEDPDGSFAACLRVPPEQHATCDVQDMLKALAKLGLKGKIFMATFDLSPEISAGIKDGTVAFAIDQQPYLQGYIPVAVLAIMKQ